MFFLQNFKLKVYIKLNKMLFCIFNQVYQNQLVSFIFFQENKKKFSFHREQRKKCKWILQNHDKRKAQNFMKIALEINLIKMMRHNLSTNDKKRSQSAIKARRHFGTSVFSVILNCGPYRVTSCERFIINIIFFFRFTFVSK